MIKNFDELIRRVQDRPVKKKVAVVVAQDEHTLEAVFKARRDQLVDPILIGNKKEILKIANDLNEIIEDTSVIDILDDIESARKAVSMVHEGKVDVIMKGKIQTADLLKAVVDKAFGLRTGRLISHLVFHEIHNYHKLLAMTDGGMMMYPNLEEKKQIIENAVSVFHALGYEKPNVAVLTAVEKVNPKMPETVEADLLKKMNQKGEILNCVVEGPISYDLMISKASAEIKGYHSEVTGNTDILVVPNITAGNILGKALVYSANAKMAGIVVGAKVPIILTSRGSSTEEKYLSIVLSASVAQ
ncbi:bifunctional enoyl-CoA hydratase/phosphate acetyltransferase [Fusibacter sp. 3D3]|uniref:bifunctional enoyl-CoA hydratase/phosphate acetyltransferase n=1 Tax=Fusibacter sp. 3D3 TaxID=1048380 RepID=UPI0008533ABD|nr:bifunctional enoyl-CoA hydratase/phosphate acetyltransferase [Fusibacter sp. 3D3]GAU79518.1 phosphotransbutyrylase [Fusibacter sp. 3D3]